MVIGAGCFVFMWQQQIVCWVFLLGAFMFALMQMMQAYEGKELDSHAHHNRDKVLVARQDVQNEVDLAAHSLWYKSMQS